MNNLEKTLSEKNYPIPFSEEEYSEKMKEAENFLAPMSKRLYFTAFDGNQISYMHVSVPGTKTAVVISIGFTEFAEKYTELAYYFVKCGFSVYIIEHRGHGYSYRPVSDTAISHIDNFDDYVSDFSYFITSVICGKNRPEKLFVFSHSLGACIAGLSLARPEVSKCVTAAVFSSPMLSFAPKIIPDKFFLSMVEKNVRKNGAENVFKYARPFSSEASFALSGDTSYERFKRNLQKRIDNINYRGSLYTNGWIHQAVFGVKCLLNCAEKITTDALVLTGSLDSTIKRPSQKKFAKKLPHAKYLCISGAKHSIFTSEKEKFGEALNIVLDFYGGRAAQTENFTEMAGK